MMPQVKSKEVFVYSYIALTLQWNAHTYKFKIVFENKNPKRYLFLLEASCPFLSVCWEGWRNLRKTLYLNYLVHVHA